MKLFTLLLFVSVSVTAFAQSSGRFTLTRSVMAGGGATFSTSSRFQLGSTVAQPLAAMPSSSRFSIQGGFWIVPSFLIFTPSKAGSNFVFSFETELGKTYALEYTDSLTTPSWQSLPGLAGNGAVQSVTNAAPGITNRFFRVRGQ